jgi:hypothetical protein
VDASGLQHSPHRVWAREESPPPNVERNECAWKTGAIPGRIELLEPAYGQGGRPRWRDQALCKKPADREQHAQRNSPRFERETVSQGLFQDWVDRDGPRVRRPMGSERGGSESPASGQPGTEYRSKPLALAMGYLTSRRSDSTLRFATEDVADRLQIFQLVSRVWLDVGERKGDAGRFPDGLHNDIIEALLTSTSRARFIRAFPCHAPPVPPPEVSATTS